MAAEAAFERYDFEGDPRWRNIEANLLIPDSMNREAVLLKKKRKYYQTHVDPSYTPPADDQASTSSSSSSSHSTSSSAASSQPGESKSSSSTSSSRGPRAASSASSSSSSSSSPVDVLSLVQLASHVAIMAAALFYLLPLWGPQVQSAAYYWLHRFSIAQNGIYLFRAFGVPKFNKEYGMRLLRDEHTMFLFAAVVLSSAAPVFVAIVPATLRAALYFGRGVKFLAGKVAFAESLARLMEPVVARTTEIWSLNATLEIATGFVFLAQMLTASRNLMTLFMYWQFLRIRYMVSQPGSATRLAWTHTRVTAEKYCPAALRGALATVSSFLTRMVHIDPQQQQQPPRCVVM